MVITALCLYAFFFFPTIIIAPSTCCLHCELPCKIVVGFLHESTFAPTVLSSNHADQISRYLGKILRERLSLYFPSFPEPYIIKGNDRYKYQIQLNYKANFTFLNFPFRLSNTFFFKPLKL